MIHHRNCFCVVNYVLPNKSVILICITRVIYYVRDNNVSHSSWLNCLSSFGTNNCNIVVRLNICPLRCPLGDSADGRLN